MGETQNQPFQLSFNTTLKVEFQGSRVTSDGGLSQVRELDERLGFGKLIEEHLTDPAGERIPSFRFPICFASRSTAGWRATKTSMTPSGWPRTRPFV